MSDVALDLLSNLGYFLIGICNSVFAVFLRPGGLLRTSGVVRHRARRLQALPRGVAATFLTLAGLNPCRSLAP